MAARTLQSKWCRERSATVTMVRNETYISKQVSANTGSLIQSRVVWSFFGLSASRLRRCSSGGRPHSLEQCVIRSLVESQLAGAVSSFQGTPPAVCSRYWLLRSNRSNQPFCWGLSAMETFVSADKHFLGTSDSTTMHPPIHQCIRKCSSLSVVTTSWNELNTRLTIPNAKQLVNLSRRLAVANMRGLRPRGTR